MRRLYGVDRACYESVALVNGQAGTGTQIWWGLTLKISLSYQKMDRKDRLALLPSMGDGGPQLLSLFGSCSVMGSFRAVDQSLWALCRACRVSALTPRFKGRGRIVGALGPWGGESLNLCTYVCPIGGYSCCFVFLFYFEPVIQSMWWSARMSAAESAAMHKKTDVDKADDSCLGFR
jgi:hypothetical protein